MLSKDAKHRIQSMKKRQLQDLSDAVEVLENARVITTRRAIAIDRYILMHGGKKARR